MSRTSTDTTSPDGASLAGVARGVAHDFRNLLFVITAHCQRLNQAMAADDDRRRDVEAITLAAERAVALTQHLLASGEDGDIALRAVDLNQVIAGLDELLRYLAGRNVSVVTHLGAEMPPLQANATQLEQIVMNLVANARDAMPAGGAVTVSTRRRRTMGAAGTEAPESVVLTVSDTGMGMTREVQARMFEPYFTTKGAAGTGIGLATVQAIVISNGGHIEVSSAPGKGTSISVILPAARRRSVAAPVASSLAPQPMEPAGSHEDRGGLANRRVLLVDDEPGVRALLSHCLSLEGYELIVASSGAEALALCRDSDAAPDVVVMDLRLPDMSGAEVVARLREQRRGIGVVLISGQQTAEVQRDAMTIDDVPVPLLTKPFSLADFKRTVRDVINTMVAA